jgi:hypothetical protein
MRDGDWGVITPNALGDDCYWPFDSDSDKTEVTLYYYTMVPVSVVTSVMIVCPYRNCMPNTNTLFLVPVKIF